MDFMHRALDLAEEAAGGLSPRPPVGAVIVAPDGKTIVGEGATQPNPGPHAEAVAIANARDAAKGATIYCTLEPHQTQSTTPPAPKPSSTPESNASSAPLPTPIHSSAAAASNTSEPPESKS